MTRKQIENLQPGDIIKYFGRNDCVVFSLCCGNTVNASYKNRKVKLFSIYARNNGNDSFDAGRTIKMYAEDLLDKRIGKWVIHRKANK